MYTAVDDVKDRIGSSNIPSAITDAMIQQFIVDGDAYIDDRTNSTWASNYSLSAENYGTDRAIKSISTNLALSKLYGRLGGGKGNYKIGDFSMSKKELIEQAKYYEDLAEKSLSNIDANVTIKISNQ